MRPSEGVVIIRWPPLLNHVAQRLVEGLVPSAGLFRSAPRRRDEATSKRGGQAPGRNPRAEALGVDGPEDSDARGGLGSVSGVCWSGGKQTSEMRVRSRTGTRSVGVQGRVRRGDRSRAKARSGAKLDRFSGRALRPHGGITFGIPPQAGAEGGWAKRAGGVDADSRWSMAGDPGDRKGVLDRILGSFQDVVPGATRG